MIYRCPQSLVKKEMLEATVMGGVRYNISPGEHSNPEQVFGVAIGADGNPWRVALQTHRLLGDEITYDSEGYSGDTELYSAI